MRRKLRRDFCSNFLDLGPKMTRARTKAVQRSRVVNQETDNEIPKMVPANHVKVARYKTKRSNAILYISICLQCDESYAKYHRNLLHLTMTDLYLCVSYPALMVSALSFRGLT